MPVDKFPILLPLPEGYAYVFGGEKDLRQIDIQKRGIWKQSF